MSSTPPASRRARVNSITKHFASLPDPRVARTRVHLLTDLITIAILAVIAGAKGWDDIETYAEAWEPMLREFLDLPGGAPSDDTFCQWPSETDPSWPSETDPPWPASSAAQRLSVAIA